MKFLYILTSRDDDLYYEQIYLSITSLLLYNLNANIELLTDDITFKTLKGSRKKILELVQECKVIPLSSDLSQEVRSRLLKTNMRNLIDGDFLYLDCDTIVLSPLEIPQNWTFSIGAVKNLHFNSVTESPIYPIFLFFANKCGIDIETEDYFNSGVLYVKDNVESRKFFTSWHKLYLKFFKEHNVEIDQLSLYRTNNDFGGFIHEVSGVWNWQVGFGLNYMCESKIMHTFSSVTHHLHDIHFLKKKKFYQEMKLGLYNDSEIIHIIHNARSLFNEKVRIVPIDNHTLISKESFVEFYKNYKQIYFYGNENIFLQAQETLHQYGIGLDNFIYYGNETEKSHSMDTLEFTINNLQISQKHEVGFVIGVNLEQINKVLSNLLARKLMNIFIYI